MSKPTIYFAIDKARVHTTGPNKGKAHIKLWVTFRVRTIKGKVWQQRPYQTYQYCTLEDFAVVMDKNIKRVATYIADIRSKLVEIENRAAHIIDDLGVTSQQQFENLFLIDGPIESIRNEFALKITELLDTGTADKPKVPRISTAEKYGTAMHSLQKFFGDEVVITFDMLTPEKLQEYEDWYVSQPRKKGSTETKSITSVGINLRHARHIVKRGITKGLTRNYPFGLGKYVIPEGGEDDTKQFMDTSEKDAFIQWSHANERLNELHDYAVFSYYANGINMADIARLRKTSLFKEYISITRQKTKGKKKKNKKLVIPMHPVMREIIDRRGRKSLIPDDFVFPVLEYGMDEETIFYRIRDLVDDVNDMLAIMAKELKLEIKPTSYTLRHTFSFHFMKAGGTTDDLQDALAHGSIKTTEHYKHGFELEHKKKFSQGL